MLIKMKPQEKLGSKRKVTVEDGRVFNKTNKLNFSKTQQFSRFKMKLQKIERVIVDVHKDGFGNTNDRNTRRRFFANPQKASEITGVATTKLI